MNVKQQTVRSAVRFSGQGLHTGELVNMTVLPAAANHGIVFKRIDLEGAALIPALVDYVVDTSRSTVIAIGDARISTVEHVMSALAGLQIDNVLIEIDGPEVPILDGSAMPFVEGFESVGLEKQNANRNYYEITEAIDYKYKERDISLAALPLNDFKVTVMVDFNSKILPSQHAKMHEIEHFRDYIAPCRTFVFVHEIEMLAKMDLIKGGDLSNAVVISEEVLTEEKVASLRKLLNRDFLYSGKAGVLNDTPLKFSNEPARHKLLDIVGDLALVGRPLKGHILAARPGHAANVSLAKLIKKQIDAADKSAPNVDLNAEPVMNVACISSLLPHRYPFQLVDKIMSLDGTTVVGVKNITMNEPYFMGHFPDNPVMPGVLQVEAIAQTGGVLVLSSTGKPMEYWPYLVSIENCRFYKNVVPGDTLVIRCSLLSAIRLGLAKMHGEAWVGRNLVCSVNMMARLVKKK